MDKHELLKIYLTKNKLMQLATTADGQPWLCNVYFVADPDANLYWTSARKRRHSKEINADPRAAVTIVHDPEHKQALQLTGKAYEVALSDVARVNALYAEKFGDKPSRLEEVLADTPDGRAYWMFKPEKLFFWDEVNFPGEAKQEVIL